MDPLYQADLARNIAELERRMRLICAVKSELLEALAELNDASCKVQAAIEESRQALGRQSGKEIWPFALCVNGRIDNFRN